MAALYKSSWPLAPQVREVAVVGEYECMSGSNTHTLPCPWLPSSFGGPASSTAETDSASNQPVSACVQALRPTALSHLQQA